MPNIELPESSGEWPNAIKALGSKLSKVQTVADDFQDFSQSANKIEQDLSSMAFANLRGILAIYSDIQAENYKQLLTMPKYYT